MGASGKMLMFHHSNWWYSADGGHNFKMGNLPGGGGSFDYVRLSGSRSEPAGTVYAILDAPPALSTTSSSTTSTGGDGDGDGDKDGDYDPSHKEGGKGGNDDDDDDDDEEAKEMDPLHIGYTYNPGLPSTADALGSTLGSALGGNIKYLMTSTDYGSNWTWAPLPSDLQAGGLTVDPTSPHSLFALTDSCLANSKDGGKTWSACSKATGLTGKFTKLLIKTTAVMFMLRGGAVPLRTQDGGKTWTELTGCAVLFKYGATMDGSLSWSGRTLVLTGFDGSAIGRNAYGTAVWKSADDGETWTDETGDLVTISPGPGVWFEKDYYQVTRGEGLTVKRNFE